MSGVYTPLGEVAIPIDYECVDALYIHLRLQRHYLHAGGATVGVYTPCVNVRCGRGGGVWCSRRCLFACVNINKKIDYIIDNRAEKG